jgi:hypothetical protein
MAKPKSLEAYAREVAASYGVSPERAGVLAAFAKKAAVMDALQAREAMFSKDLPDPLARLLVTARQMEIRGEPLTESDTDDYAANRAAADEMESAGNKDGAARLRAGIATAEAQDRGNP